MVGGARRGFICGVVFAVLERIGGRILGCLLLSLSVGLISFTPYPPVFPPPAPSTPRVSDGSVSEYSRVAGEGGLERGSDGENDPAALGFGVTRSGVVLKFS